MLRHVGRQGLLIGEVAAKLGVSRKAIRLYEAMGILPPSGRTESGYRIYGSDALALLAFVARARRLGLSLTEIRDIVELRRAGLAPCDHVRALLRRKVADLERLRRELRDALGSWRSRRCRRAVVCPHIEARGGEEQ